MSENKNIGLFSRISNWYKDEKFFFRKDQEGRDLFYPWGYPGESVFLDDKQKRRMYLYINAVSCAFPMWVVLCIVAQELTLINGKVGDLLFLFGLTWIIPAYVFFTYLIIRKKESLILAKERRLAKWGFIWIFLLSVLQLHEFYLLVDKMSVITVLFFIVGFIFTLYVFIRVLLTRGYFFSD